MDNALRILIVDDHSLDRVGSGLNGTYLRLLCCSLRGTSDVAIPLGRWFQHGLEIAALTLAMTFFS